MRSGNARLRPAAILLQIGLLLFFAPSANSLPAPEVEVVISDASAWPGESGVEVSIYLKNYSATVSGFQIHLESEEPEAVQFQVAGDELADTTFWICDEFDNFGSCLSQAEVPIDLIVYECRPYDNFTISTTGITGGAFDTVGTLISGWGMVRAESVNGDGSDMRITAMAEWPPPPYSDGIAFPQDGTTPLIKLLVDFADISDTATVREIPIAVRADAIENLHFIDPQANYTAVHTDTVCDTTYYDCALWLDPGVECAVWQETSAPTGDTSIVICNDSYSFDSELVTTTAGVMTFFDVICGDINSSMATPDISDLTFLVEYFFGGGPPPRYDRVADMDNSGAVDISDLTYFVDYLFGGGPAPDCPVN